jgi:WD40 repeat protein
LVRVRPSGGQGGRTGFGSSVGGFAWSHDGTRIAYGRQGGSICVADIRTGATRRIHRFWSGNDVSSVAWSPDDKQIAFIDGSGGSYDPNYSAWVMAADGHHALRLPR